jgi:hypothetical protein
MAAFLEFVCEPLLKRYLCIPGQLHYNVTNTNSYSTDTSRPLISFHCAVTPDCCHQFRYFTLLLETNIYYVNFLVYLTALYFEKFSDYNKILYAFLISVCDIP